jgi:FixJ family two-component response regulator
MPVVAIIDDDESVREGTMDLFKSMGFTAVAFSCAADFLRSNRLYDTSCLIVDVQLPGMTGLELYNRLVGSGSVIPTILITAYPDEGDRARALQHGIICYLAKPFNYNDLLACVHLALEPREAIG